MPSKLILGIGLYGRSFTLAGSQTGIGAPAKGAGDPGTYTREGGFLAYNEVKTICICWGIKSNASYAVQPPIYLYLFKYYKYCYTHDELFISLRWGTLFHLVKGNEKCRISDCGGGVRGNFS